MTISLIALACVFCGALAGTFVGLKLPARSALSSLVGPKSNINAVESMRLSELRDRLRFALGKSKIGFALKPLHYACET